MVSLKKSELRIIEDAFNRVGYVLDFSGDQYEEFFEEELGVNIWDEKYGFHGGSKGKRLRRFVEVEGPTLVVDALRKLWTHYEDSCAGELSDLDKAKKKSRLELCSRLDAGLTRVVKKVPARAWTKEELERRSQ